jgi:hypothetical protein
VAEPAAVPAGGPPGGVPGYSRLQLVGHVTTALIAAVTVGLLMRFGRRAPEPLIVVVAAAIGLGLRAG